MQLSSFWDLILNPFLYFFDWYIFNSFFKFFYWLFFYNMFDYLVFNYFSFLRYIFDFLYRRILNDSMLFWNIFKITFSKWFIWLNLLNLLNLLYGRIRLLYLLWYLLLWVNKRRCSFSLLKLTRRLINGWFKILEWLGWRKSSWIIILILLLIWYSSQFIAMEL